MNKSEPHHSGHLLPYLRFAGMIVTSTVIMYAAMYLNNYAWDHVYFSETRAYMSLLMGAIMAVVMLTFMLTMHPDWRINAGIYVASVLIFALALWLVRSQRTVDEVSYMRAMIPHHSIAILTSERAHISDPRVRKLADQIIETQRKEIAEMKSLIADLDGTGSQQQHSTESKSTSRQSSKLPALNASTAEVLSGFEAEVVMSGLTYPTSVEFDEAGNLYIAEAGYAYGDPKATPRVLRVSRDGSIETVAEGEALVGPISDLLWHEGRMYVSHRGKISVIEEGGKIRDIVKGLPSDGDHHNNQMSAGPDGKIYFGQGTVTNSGMVGLDNYKMGWLKDHRELHDVPARDVALVGRVFQTTNPFTPDDDNVQTSAFHPFAQVTSENSRVAGQPKASGTILRMNADGTELEVYAWGLRNPFGVMWSPDGKLYATENGCDVRGSRPIANDEEDIYVINEGSWYGWPDYAMGLPVTHERFRPEGNRPLEFLMSKHPSVEKPWLNFPKHSSITKVEFSDSEAFGTGHMFVAFFGHMSPMTGEAPEQHGGHRVVRIDPATKNVETFFKQKHHGHGDEGHSNGKAHQGGGQHASKQSEESVTAGPRRLMDVRFAPDGNALYIADFGAMSVEEEPKPVPKTGVVWRVVPVGGQTAGPPTGLSASR